MTAINRLYDAGVSALDVALGWLLWLPRDLSLLLFAVGTALLMTLIRRAVTNQDLLGRCAADLRRLKQLIVEAKRAGDREVVARRKQTIAQIKGMQLIADLRVLAVAIVPVGALALWASERFDYLPPRIGEDVIVRAYFPLASVDRLTHLVPPAEATLKSPAIQLVRRDDGSPPGGVAEWTISASEPVRDLELTIRHQGETARHRVAIGQLTYLPPVQMHSNARLKATEIPLRRYHPLGLDLRSDAIGLPPWVVGYVLLTLLLVPGLKRRFRIG